MVQHRTNVIQIFCVYWESSFIFLFIRLYIPSLSSLEWYVLIKIHLIKNDNIHENEDSLNFFFLDITHFFHFSKMMSFLFNQ